MENEGINLIMAEYEENVNLVAKINTELCKRYGLENYLTEFSSNLIRQLNQYKRFVMMMPNRKSFVEAILEFSKACISFFEENKDKNVSDYDAMKNKMSTLVASMNHINDIINENLAEGVKDYIK